METLVWKVNDANCRKLIYVSLGDWGQIVLDWLINLNKYLEPLYYIASIGLFASVIIGLYQLKLMKSDLKTKNQRAAMEKSLQYLDWFASDFFPAQNNFMTKQNEIKRAMMEKAKDDKHRNRFQNAFKKAHIEFDVNDTFIKNTRELDEYAIPISCMSAARADNILNQLEYFAAAMSCGLADEELAFNPLSDAYCNVVEELYLMLCTLRTDNDKLYSNVIKLYRIWKSRINKQALEGKRQEISAKISQIQDTNIKPLGL